MTTHAGLELRGAVSPSYDEVLSPDALEFGCCRIELGRRK